MCRAMPARCRWGRKTSPGPLPPRRRGLAINLVRNGSRGLYWLEPLVEVATPLGRIAYGPVAAADVPGLFERSFLKGWDHPLCRGRIEQQEWLRSQQRLTFARVGIT